MDHQGEYRKEDILGSMITPKVFIFMLLKLFLTNFTFADISAENWHEKCNVVPISAEELKIRSELGMEIENELEKEIKEGIYQLALRLHRIYQERKERSAKETFGGAVSEVKISIRMEGRSKVEMREVKNVKKGGSYVRNSWPQNVKEVKKVDWVKSLRGGSSAVCGSRLSSVSSKKKGENLSTGPNALSNGKIHGGSFGLVKQNASVDKKMLQLGWKV
ncbi:hypothetical protein DEO72_LG4g1650 [Vigna unguiculata]|uniref:Uncharacterized protein n=1 Tax=Vigna unguiculata TaxID=3917 RepID=A0A4D6LQC7_VIGUN|nr:hypothetical protein DEO72_LG4g1650 [Vigna unguiculata]